MSDRLDALIDWLKSEPFRGPEPFDPGPPVGVAGTSALSYAASESATGEKESDPHE